MNNVFNYKNFLAITVGLFLTAVSLYGQNDGPVGILLGATGELGGSRMNITDDLVGVKNLLDSDQSSIFAFGAGFDVGLKLGSVYILSGFSFNSRGGVYNANAPWERVRSTYLEKGDSILVLNNENSRPPSDDTPFEIQETITMNHFRVPLLIGYGFGTPGFEVRVAGGIGFNSFIGSNANFSKELTWRDGADATRSYNEDTSDGFYRAAGNDDLAPIGYNFGDNQNDRYSRSTTSLILTSSVYIKINENGFLRLGVLYESYGNLINPEFRYRTLSQPDRLVNPRGRNTMSAVSMLIGYEYRISGGGGSGVY